MTAKGRKTKHLSFKAAVKYLFAILFGTLFFAAAGPLRAHSQTAAAASPAFEYEVASIKLNISGGASIGMHNTADSYSVTNVLVETPRRLTATRVYTHLEGKTMWKSRAAIGLRAEPVLKRPRSLLICFSTFLLFAAAPPLGAQSQAQTAASPAPVFEFEVATIKPNKSNSGSMRAHSTPDGYTITNVSVQALIQLAFGIQDYQLLAAPEWLSSEHYDIEAKMDPAVADAFQKLSPDERKPKRLLMLQALLIDRLKLTIHHETRELPVYSLVIAKNGSKLQETKRNPATPDVPVGRGGASVTTDTGNGPITLTVLHCPSADLASVFAPYVGRTVVDRTGLTSVYDFTLQFTPDDKAVPSAGARPTVPDTTAPSIFSAVQEQLGLKLEPGKGPVDVIVIDHVERPSGN